MMKHILMINGYEAYPHARGKLNHTIFTAMADRLGETYDVKKTVLQTCIRSYSETPLHFRAEIYDQDLKSFVKVLPTH